MDFIEDWQPTNESSGTANDVWTTINKSIVNATDRIITGTTDKIVGQTQSTPSGQNSSTVWNPLFDFSSYPQRDGSPNPGGMSYGGMGVWILAALGFVVMMLLARR